MSSEDGVEAHQSFEPYVQKLDRGRPTLQDVLVQNVGVLPLTGSSHRH